jgi:hypothetical protein
VSLSGVKGSIASITDQIASLRFEIESGFDGLDNIDASDDNKLFIIDSQDNVIAYIDENGIRTTNLFIGREEENILNYRTAIEKLE